MNKFLLVTIIFVLTAFADISHAYIFGQSGSGGYSGDSGRDGRGGADIDVQALGQSEYFNIRGQDGSNGSRGGEGGDAYSCYQNRGEYNEEGAPGGDGGNGGRGGYGGNGGDIRVYFQDRAKLKNIFVDSTPGRAGYAGEGARGGRACICSDRSWSRKICRQEKETRRVCTPAGCDPRDKNCHCRNEDHWYEVCEWREFYCTDGRDGRDGSYGSRGNEGSYGAIELISRLEPLEATQPSLSDYLENILTTNYTLTRHEWDHLTGAVTLFAPGSQIRNDYQLYAGKTVKTVSFQWLDSARGVDYYRGSRVDLNLYGKPATVNFNVSSNILATTKTETRGDHTTVTFNKTMRQDELTKIRVLEMEGANEDLTLVLIDEANVSDVAKTNILIDSGWDLEGGGEYNTWVPQELIRSEAGKIYVNLGRLPGIKGSKIKKYFGEKCEFEIEVTREFAGTSLRVVRDGGNVFDIVKEVKKKKPIQVKMEWEN